MPLTLAERVRERRNQRLAASAQRRAMNEKSKSNKKKYANVSSPPSDKIRSSLTPLVSVLDMDPNEVEVSTVGYQPGSILNISSDASTPQRGSSTTSRALVSPLNLPGKPPASPIAQRGYSLSAPSSPHTFYPSSPSAARPSSSSRARNLYNSIPTGNQNQQRGGIIVSPHSIPYLSNSSPSWEDPNDNVPTINLSLRSDRSVLSEFMPRVSSTPQPILSSSARNDSHSVYSESHLDDHDFKNRRRTHKRSPSMDERSYGSRRSIDEDDSALLRPRRSKPPSSVRLDNSLKALPPPSSSERRPAEDDVSSLGGVEDHLSTASRTSLARLTAAVRTNTPKGLVAEERALWETFQNSLAASRKAALEEADPKMREKLKQQQEEQDKSLRAIQRVLADVSEDRDRASTLLKESKQEQRKLQRLVEKLEEQVEELRDSRRNGIIADHAAQDSAASSSNTELEELKSKIKNLEEDKEKLGLELDSRNKQITKLKHNLHGKGDVVIEDSDGMKKELEERTAALENAKMIIASLENASGSLASDTRSKLKAKDVEISSLKTDARHQQKKLDNLATQLKEVQGEKAKLASERSHEIGRLAVWKSTLRDRLSEMQSAAVILEATRDDPAAAERFSNVVAEAMETMQKTVDDLEYVDEEDGDRHSPGGRYDGSYAGNDVDSIASGRSTASRLSRDTSREVKQELEEKTAAIKRLEEDLKKSKEEALISRLEAERIEQQRESDTKTLYGEIQMLRIQCNTNMELLAKKERELAVLRDSLKVEDDDVGYISDDATDVEDEDEDTPASTANLSMSQYSASQTEAFAALLAHGGGGSVDTSLAVGQSTDADQLRSELTQAKLDAERSRKELKIEKESLANAKMIISSLEKANKSMMEDLRSRLQESNSAIHSLLEKSMESEKTTKRLEAEVEALRREKEELLSKKGGLLAGEEKKEEVTEK